MAVETSKYALQALFEVTVIDLESQNATRLDELKNTNWSDTSNTTYVTGARGGAKIIGFGSQKESMLEIESAVLSDGLFGMQTGTDVEVLTDTTEVMFTDLGTDGKGLVIASVTTTTTYTATGVVGAEIFGVYVMNSDGSFGERVTKQVAIAPTANDEFQYTSGSKLLTFNAGCLKDGDRVAVLYYPTASSAKKFVNRTDVFSKNVQVIADGLFVNTCTGETYWSQLCYKKAKVNPDVSYSLTESGEPAVSNLKFEALKPCGSKELWSLYILDEDDLE